MIQDKTNATDIEAWRRKLIFRSSHRGTKEMDLMLGRFATAHLPGFSAAELILYEALLRESDPDLYDWLTFKAAPPEHCRHDVMEKLLRFHGKLEK